MASTDEHKHTATEHAPADTEHVLDKHPSSLLVSYLTRRIQMLDQQIFPLKGKYEQALLAALERARISTAEPEKCIPFLRELFKLMKMDKGMFFNTVLKRLGLYTHEVLDFLKEIELELPYNIKKDELDGLLTHGCIDPKLWERLGSKTGMHDALNIAIKMGNSPLAMALENEVGAEGLRATFDPTGAESSLFSLEKESFVLIRTWLSARKFFSPETRRWGNVMRAARQKRADLLPYLLAECCGVTASQKNALLRVALEELNVPMLNVLKPLGFVSEQMITEIARPMLEAMSVNLLPYNEMQEKFAQDVALVEQWVDENFPVQ